QSAGTDQATGASSSTARRPQEGPGGPTPCSRSHRGASPRAEPRLGAGRAAWPLSRALGLSEREKVPVKTLVARQLGVKARGEEPALPRGDDGTVAQARENLDPGTHAADPRRANEHRVERRRAERLDVEIRFERLELSAERVPFHGHVHERRERMGMARDLFGDEDRARACPPDGHAFGDAVLELVDDAVLARELSDGRALATRDDQRIDLVELLGSAHVDAFDAEPIERSEMLREITLQTEDAGARGQRAAITNRGLQVVLAPGSTRAKDRASPRRVRAKPRRRAWRRGSAWSLRRSPSRDAPGRRT